MRVLGILLIFSFQSELYSQSGNNFGANLKERCNLKSLNQVEDILGREGISEKKYLELTAMPQRGRPKLSLKSLKKMTTQQKVMIYHCRQQYFYLREHGRDEIVPQ